MSEKNFLSCYTKFLISNKNNFSCLELSKVSGVSHDRASKLLKEKKVDTSDLWNEVKDLIGKDKGYLVVDDSTLDKSYSRVNELTAYHWSGNTHSVINGISIVNMLWSDGDKYVPVDYRIYQPKKDEKYLTKNDHFQNMVIRAKSLKIKPFYVLADCWYGSVDNMKFVNKLGWKFIFGMKENRLVNVTKGIYVKVSDLDWTKTLVQKVWLKDFGYVLVSKIVLKDETIRYVVTNDLELKDFDKLKSHNDKRWKVETFHRGIKQTTGIEKCYSTLEASQRTHIYTCYLAFIKLEFTRIQTNKSWYEQKNELHRIAVKNAILA
jgi:putative transposase